jgi:mitochondrial intermembrane space import and assembly protein 40
MTEIQKFGKDTVIFASREDHATPSKIELPESEAQPGLLLPSGEINWNCPCLGGMATGPCGVEFREAFSCFHYSESETKGAECYDAFKTMRDCFSKYPSVYKQDDEENDADLDGMLDEDEIEKSSKASAEPRENKDYEEAKDPGYVDLDDADRKSGEVATKADS